jgi:Protein of unknown function (DUF2924)
MAKAAPRAIEDEINRLRSLALDELRGEWQRLYAGEPPQISRDLLVLGLGYRIQEIEQGGSVERRVANFRRSRRIFRRRVALAQHRASP